MLQYCLYVYNIVMLFAVKNIFKMSVKNNSLSDSKTDRQSMAIVASMGTVVIAMD